MFPRKTIAPSLKFPKSLRSCLAKTTERTTLPCPFRRLTPSKSGSSAKTIGPRRRDREREGHRTPEIRMEKTEAAMAPGQEPSTLHSTVARARAAWDVGTAVRHASRAWVCSCAVLRNSWPTNGTHISWLRTSLRSRRASSIPHNGSSRQSPAYHATGPGCWQAARE